MKIVIKKQLAEASRRNISSTLASRIIKRIAYAVAGSNFIDPVIIDVTPDIEELKKISPKFDLELKEIHIKFSDEGSYGSANKKVLMLAFPPLIRQADQEAYKKALKRPDKEESFKKRLQKVYDKKAARDASYSRDGKPSPYFLETEPKKFPLFTKVKEVNDRNIEIYDKYQGAFKYKTPEEVEKILKFIEPTFSKEKLSYVYNKIKEKRGEDSLYSIYSTAIHEFKHTRQYKSNKYLTPLFQDKTYLSLPTSFYTPRYNDFKDWKYSSDPRNAIDTFFYFSRPIEIDARIAQYRDFYSTFKKEDPSTAGDRIYDLILKKELSYAKNSPIDSGNIRYQKYKNLLVQEIESKQMYQFLYQLSKTEKNIFNSNPKFADSLEQYSNKVDEIEPELQKVRKAEVGYNFDPKERKLLIMGSYFNS